MNFRPYGWMHVDHVKELLNPFQPLAWSGKANFYQWVEDMRKVLGDKIWPNWDDAKRRWRGKAVGSMEDLTEYDLKVMQEPLSNMPLAAFSTKGCPTHEDFFYTEDGRDGGRPGMGLKHYHPALDPSVTQRNPVGMFYTGFAELAGSTSLLLKQTLQRPRAFQVWPLQGDPPFYRYHGDTADSPSMISGHCFEGCLAGAWVALRHCQWVSGINWQEVEPTMQQWCVDIGDRRVYAQIHYPSDNIASWWVALNFLRAIESQGFADASWLRKFLLKAIPRSTVYRLMCADHPPCDLWTELHAEVGEPSAK